MQLFLIRHAQSQNNAQPTSQRVEDPGITPLGRDQAARLAARIHQLELSQLFTSPFLRTLETTDVLHQTTSLTPQVKTELHEIGGCYRGYLPEQKEGAPGMNQRQIEAAFPAFTIASNITDHGWWESKPWETRDAARERARSLLDWTREQFGGTQERVAFVTHADLKELILEHVDPRPLPSAYNTAVTAIRITPSEMRLVDFNGVAHLPPAMYSA